MSSAPSVADPCAVARIPHAGQGPTDQDIIRRQDEVRRASHSVAHVRLALYALQAGSSRTAQRHVDRALVLEPDYAPALLALGRMLLAAGNREGAIATLARAAERNPEYQWVLVEALRAAGRSAEATPVEDALVSQGTATDRCTVSLYLATSGRDVLSAVRLAEEEVRVRADVFTLDALAWAHHAAGRHQEARALLVRAHARLTQPQRRTS